MKCGAVPQFRFHPDSSAALLDNSFANRQTNAGAGELAAMQPLEDAKDLLMIPLVDADTVVSNGELNRIAGVGGRNMDLGGLGPTKAHGVGKQLPEEVRQLRKIEEYRWQRIVGDLRAALTHGRI